MRRFASLTARRQQTTAATRKVTPSQTCGQITPPVQRPSEKSAGPFWSPKPMLPVMRNRAAASVVVNARACGLGGTASHLPHSHAATTTIRIPATATAMLSVSAVYAARHCRTVATSRSGVIGFRSTQSWSRSFLLKPSDRPVTTTTGMSRVSPCDAISARTERPSSIGNVRSKITRCGGSFSIICRAVTPSSTSSTRKPANDSVSAKMRRRSRSSSTISTVFCHRGPRGDTEDRLSNSTSSRQTQPVKAVRSIDRHLRRVEFGLKSCGDAHLRNACPI